MLIRPDLTHSIQYRIFVRAFEGFVDDIGSDRVMDLDGLDGVYTAEQLLRALKTGGVRGRKTYHALRALEKKVLRGDVVNSSH